MTLTPQQIELGRHALGLPNKKHKTNRNNFVIGEGCTNYVHWLNMSHGDAAIRRDGQYIPFGGNDVFHLTEAGARQCLKGKETLDMGDFPPRLRIQETANVTSNTDGSCGNSPAVRPLDSPECGK